VVNKRRDHVWRGGGGRDFHARIWLNDPERHKAGEQSDEKTDQEAVGTVRSLPGKSKGKNQDGPKKSSLFKQSTAATSKGGEKVGGGEEVVIEALQKRAKPKTLQRSCGTCGRSDPGDKVTSSQSEKPSADWCAKSCRGPGLCLDGGCGRRKKLKGGREGLRAPRNDTGA